MRVTQLQYGAILILILAGLGVYAGFSTGSSEILFTVSGEVVEVATVNGSVMYISETDMKDDNYALFRGEEKVLSADDIDHLRSFGGRPAYSMEENNTEYVVVDRQRHTVPESVRRIGEIAGQPAILVGDSYILFNGSRHGEQYRRVVAFTDANRRPAYIAVRNNTTILVQDGSVKQANLFRWRRLRLIKQLIPLQNLPHNLAYTGSSFVYLSPDWEAGRVYLSKDGGQASEAFDRMRLLGVMGTRVAYTGAYSRVELGERYLFHGDRRVAGDQVRHPVYVNGSWAYVNAVNQQERGNGGSYQFEYAVFYDGERLTRAYDQITALVHAKNGLVFVTRLNDGNSSTYKFRRVPLQKS